MGVILSNNRIKGDLFLNQSCVSGLVLESMLLMDTLQNSFPQTVIPNRVTRDPRAALLQVYNDRLGV
jgi:hypothetical protein